MHGEGTAARRHTGRLDRAAVGLDDRLGNRQPEPDIPRRAEACAVCPVETLENVWQVGCCDSLASAGNSEFNAIWRVGQGHSHFAAGAVVEDGVADEVRGHLY